MSFSLDNPYLIAAVALGLLNLGLWAFFTRQFRQYQRRQSELVRGEEFPNLEEIVRKHKKLLITHDKTLRELGKILQELIERNQRNVQKVVLKRFNPFADTGGNMSFSVALLDGENSGIVISSLHARDRTRIYAKPVKNGKSSFPLTEEEQEAIAQGRHSQQNN